MWFFNSNFTTRRVAETLRVPLYSRNMSIVKHLSLGKMCCLVSIILFTFSSCTPGNIRSDITIAALSECIESMDSRIVIQDTIELEGNPEAVFGRVTRLTLTDNLIIILDNWHSQRLFVFSRNGEFLSRTEKGKGPTEVALPSDYVIDPQQKNIQIYDLLNRRMSTFDLHLRHIESTGFENLFMRSFRKLADGRWLVHHQNAVPGSDDPTAYSYLIYGEDFSTIDTALLPDHRFEDARKFINLDPINRTDYGVYVCRPYDDHIYHWTGDGFEPTYYVDFGKLGIGDRDISKGSDYVSAQIRDGERANLIGDLIVTERYVCGTYSHEREAKYFIHDLVTGDVFNSARCDHLPKGRLLGIEKDRFVVLTEQTSSESNEEVASISNDNIVLFSID